MKKKHIQNNNFLFLKNIVFFFFFFHMFFFLFQKLLRINLTKSLFQVIVINLRSSILNLIKSRKNYICGKNIFLENPKTLLDSCPSAIVKEWHVCHTVAYDLRCPSLDLGFFVLARPHNDGAFGC